MAKPARFQGEQLKYVQGLIRLHGVSGARSLLAKEGISVARNTLINISSKAGIKNKAGRRPSFKLKQKRSAYVEVFDALYPDFPTGK